MTEQQEEKFYKELHTHRASVVSKDKLVRVDLDWSCGEGISGDYQGPEEDDIPLLRFDVFRKSGRSWEIVDDASYCTQIPAYTSKKEIKRLAAYLLKEVEDGVASGVSIKKLCEDLSWINPTWGTKKSVDGWWLDDELERRKHA